MQSKIKDFYSGKNIFITGSTGFVGIVLLEKLLRTIPNSGTIFVLLRPKDGQTVEGRLETIKKSHIFETLLKTKTLTDIFEKVKPVAGDITQIGLGLSEKDKKLIINKVNVFFHVAASIDFTVPLNIGIENNILGTRKVIDFARNVQNLNVFVYVSSSFANTWTQHSEEKIYRLNIDLESIINTVNSVSEKELLRITPQLLGVFKSVYTFTKYFGELEVLKLQDKVPCTIVRPGIILGTWQDPIPYCPINKENIHASLLGIIKGVVRRSPEGINTVYDYIPVDIVVNNIITAGCHAAINKVEEATIYNCTTSTRNPFRWKYMYSSFNKRIHDNPLESAVWYPRIKVLPSFFMYQISIIFFHILPALILDGLLIVTGKRPLLTKIHFETLRVLKSCQPFMNIEFTFAAENWNQLQQWMDPEEQIIYNLDVSSLNWDEFFWGLTQGIKKYICHESLDNADSAKRKDFLLKVCLLFVQGGLLFLMWYLFNSVFKLSTIVSSVCLFIYYYVFNIYL